jgi:hypothetical protein
LLAKLHGADGVVKSFPFEPRVDSEFYIYSFRDEVPLVVDSNFAFMQTMGSGSLTSAGLSLAERYSGPCVGRFMLIDDTARYVDTVAVFPESHRTKFHYSRSPIIVTRGDTTFYAFSDGDSIYSYNLAAKARRRIASLKKLDNDYQPILMEEDSSYYIPYIIKHATVSPAIRLFLFDPYRKTYYLGIKKYQPYLAEDGIHINDGRDFPFRMLVLDEQFRKVKSVDVPKGRFQALYHSFVGEKGLYLMLKDKNTIRYEVYDFSGSRSH